MKTMYVCIDGPAPLTVYEARSKGERWNGWQVPYFKRAEAERLVAQCDGHWEGDTAFTPYPLPEGMDYEEWGPTEIEGEQYWSIGGWAWVWEEALQLQTVWHLLKQRGIEASIEYPYYLEVAQGEYAHAFGTVDGPWGSTIYRDADRGEPVGGAESELDEQSDPIAVADWIQHQLQTWKPS